MIESFLVFLGLATVLSVNVYLYFTAYRRDSGFTGLLDDEEDYLMDTAVAVAGLQVTYFMWRGVHVFLSPGPSPVDLGLALLGLFFLGVFSYRSYSLVGNIRELKERYDFDVQWGGG
ncbi:MAG: hypothetical protein ABEJ62_00140 [Candidatus Nanohaloarchaea archaeon]